jgi:hypothetical protein
MHITYPRGMQALENYASKIGINIKDPDVQTGTGQVGGATGTGQVGGATGTSGVT